MLWLNFFENFCLFLTYYHLKLNPNVHQNLNPKLGRIFYLTVFIIFYIYFILFLLHKLITSKSPLFII